MIRVTELWAIAPTLLTRINSPSINHEGGNLMELAVAIGLGLWFVVMGVAATVRVFKDFKD